MRTNRYAVGYLNKKGEKLWKFYNSISYKTLAKQLKISAKHIHFIRVNGD